MSEKIFWSGGYAPPLREWVPVGITDPDLMHPALSLVLRVFDGTLVRRRTRVAHSVRVRRPYVSS